ncbi:MAG: malate dehydrogenase [Candidatus Omnitrophica bacterium]|nr:malate dehydrogenase [Candidatus Omnitrophota bacterium]
MKVAIIGAGHVGATTAQRIAEANLADVVLLDIVKGRAEAVALDLSSATSIVGHSCSIKGTDDEKAIAGADVVVLTAGQTRKPGQKRENLLRTNGKIVKKVAQQIARHCLGSIVIVVTNPVDVMTYLTFKTTGFAANQIIGMGGTSDCARFNMLAAAELNTASQHIHSMIIGSHGNDMVILPRLSTVLGIPITDLLPRKRIEKIVEQTRNFGARIVELLGKGSAYFGPSAGIFSLVDSVINDRKSILCASGVLLGQYGLKNLSIGVALKIGRLGVEEIIEVKLNKKEKTEFLTAAKNIKSLIRPLL